MSKKTKTKTQKTAQRGSAEKDTKTMSKKTKKNAENRTARQCRERYKNHVKKGINTGPFTAEEDTIIMWAQAR
jgi:hypothetical protein